MEDKERSNHSKMGWNARRRILWVLLFGVFCAHLYESTPHVNGMEGDARPTRYFRRLSARSGRVARETVAPIEGRELKAALCFFGITRSLKYVYFSILLNVVQPLLHQNVRVHRYMHTYNLTKLSNKRSKERNTALDLNEYKLLEPYQGMEVSDQDEFLSSFDISNMLYGNHDTYRDRFRSLTNLACQLHSLERVTKLWLESGHKYDLVIYTRPDVLYVQPVDYSAILNKVTSGKSDRTWVIPQFGNIRGRMNDRFAMGPPTAMAIWGTRTSYVKEYTETTKLSLHAERLVKYIAEKERIRVRKHDLRFVRVRADGKSSAFWDRKQMDRWQVPVLKMS